MARRLQRQAARALRSLGYYVEKSAAHPANRRAALLREFGVDLVLDVGANVGQYGAQLREFGYAGRIVSFEPLAPAYRQLAMQAALDERWTALPHGLGRDNCESTIHVAGNSMSSSILGMLPLHEQSAPESAYTGIDSISLKRLDTVFTGIRGNASSVWLKIDTQGYELEVLAGAADALGAVPTVEIEMSLVRLYQDGPLFDEVYSTLVGKGYTLVSVEAGHLDSRTGRVLQVDGIFHR